MIAGGCGLLIAGAIWFALTQNPDATTLPQTPPSASEPSPIPQVETSWSDETERSLESVQNWIDELDVQTEEAFDVKPDLPTTP